MESEEGRSSSTTLFAVVGSVLAFGLVMLGSATAPIGAEHFGNAYYFLIRQIGFGLIPGLLLFLILRKIPTSLWERSWKSAFWVSVALLGLVFIPGLGIRINHSLSWIKLGPTSFQPGELVKLTFVIFLSGWLAENQKLLGRAFEDGLLKYLVYLGIICGLFMLQPDFGTMLVLAGTALVLAFVAGAQMKHLGAIVGVGVIAIAVLIAIAPYRLERITVLFNPNKDPYGSGYHIKQSLVAIGSGGFFGKGLGNSRQKFQYLPEVSADSIFAVIAEEMGFIVSAALIAAYAFVVLRGYQLSRIAPTEWSRYFIIGTVTWLGIQIFLNIGAMLAVLPLTGLPLPLVSHGGSSLMVTLASFGIISAIIIPPESKRQRGRT